MPIPLFFRLLNTKASSIIANIFQTLIQNVLNKCVLITIDFIRNRNHQKKSKHNQVGADLVARCRQSFPSRPWEHRGGTKEGGRPAGGSECEEQWQRPRGLAPFPGAAGDSASLSLQGRRPPGRASSHAARRCIAVLLFQSSCKIQIKAAGYLVLLVNEIFLHVDFPHVDKNIIESNSQFG